MFVATTNTCKGRWAFVALAAVTLAACSTADDTAETTSPTTVPSTVPATVPDSGAATTEPAVTSTTEAAPPADFVLGFDLFSGDLNATRAKYGVQGQNENLSPEDYFVALMDAYNDEGGISGHKIVPLNYTPPTGDVAGDVVNQERCETYFKGSTVVNALVATNDPIVNTCANDANTILFGRGFTGLDQASLDTFAGHVNPQAATFDRAALATVDLGVKAGVVKEGTSVGVIYPGCEAQKAVFNDTLKPALERAGAKVSAFESTCIRSSADQGTAVAQSPNAILQWKTDGVTAVYNLDTGFIGTALLMSEADKQGMTPTWVLSTNNEFGALNSMSPPAAQMANVIAAGWSAALDTFEMDPAKLGPKAQECIDKFTAQGIPAPANIGELANRLDVCSTFLALEVMLAGNPGEIDRSQMLTALESSSDDTAALTNSLDWTSSRQPNVTYRPVKFDPAVGQFVYTGDLTPMPES